MRTSTEATSRPRLPLNLVRDPVSHRGRHFGQVEPVLDDDVHVDLDSPAVAALHLDAVAEPVSSGQAREAPARHADDAVALGCDGPDDLRDCLGGDPDRPECRLTREMEIPVHAARLDDRDGRGVTFGRVVHRRPARPPGG